MASFTSAPSEMAFFSLLVRCGSFSATARELDVTTPAISKRLAQMEARLGVLLACCASTPRWVSAAATLRH